jgi:hypothetical protein
MVSIKLQALVLAVMATMAASKPWNMDNKINYCRSVTVSEGVNVINDQEFKLKEGSTNSGIAIFKSIVEGDEVRKGAV